MERAREEIVTLLFLPKIIVSWLLTSQFFIPIDGQNPNTEISRISRKWPQLTLIEKRKIL